MAVGAMHVCIAHEKVSLSRGMQGISQSTALNAISIPCPTWDGGEDHRSVTANIEDILSGYFAVLRGAALHGAVEYLLKDPITIGEQTKDVITMCEFVTFFEDFFVRTHGMLVLAGLLTS